MIQRTSGRRGPSLGRAVAAITVATVGALALLAVPAFAHIHPKPTSVQEGASATITFEVEHGCGESPTTKLAMQLPGGVTGATAATSAAGWTTSTAGNVVTWSGPAQAPHTPFTVSITAAMPTTPGEIHFPIVQTCQATTVSWIQVQQAGQPEPDHPAPTVDVLAPGQAAPSTTADGHGAAAGSSTTAAATTQPTATPNTAIGSSATGHAVEKKSSNTGLIVGIVIAVVVVAVAAAALLSRQRRGAR